MPQKFSQPLAISFTSSFSLGHPSLLQVAKQEAQYAAELASELAGVPFSASLQANGGGGEEGNEVGDREEGEEAEEGEEEDGEVAEDAEVEEAAQGSNVGASIAVEAGRDGSRGVVLGAESGSGVDTEQEAKEMARMLMTGKRRGLYDAMKVRGVVIYCMISHRTCIVLLELHVLIAKKKDARTFL